MRSRSSHLVLWSALVVSVLIHGFVLLPALVFASQAEADFTDFDQELQEHLEEQKDLEEQERLGLEQSEKSTMTWVGYDTYQEHLADLAEFDQAQFNEASSPEATSTVSDQNNPSPNPGKPSQPGGQPAPNIAPATSTAGGGGPIDGVGAPSGGIPTKGKGPLANAPTGAADDSGKQASDEPGKQEAKADKPTPSSKPKKPGEQSAAGGGAPPADPSESPQPPQPNAADKSSDATSTIKVPRENWISGKPLASQGLELFPKKPKFTTLQTLAGARNMIVQINLGRDGKPTLATILSTSGNGGIDAAVLASLYRWRATGTRLDGLKEKETIDITLEIVMSRRRS